MDGAAGHTVLEPLAKLAGHERPVNALSFSSDGEVLVSGVCVRERFV